MIVWGGGGGRLAPASLGGHVVDVGGAAGLGLSAAAAAALPRLAASPPRLASPPRPAQRTETLN